MDNIVKKKMKMWYFGFLQYRLGYEKWYEFPPEQLYWIALFGNNYYSDYTLLTTKEDPALHDLQCDNCACTHNNSYAQIIHFAALGGRLCNHKIEDCKCKILKITRWLFDFNPIPQVFVN